MEEALEQYTPAGLSMRASLLSMVRPPNGLAGVFFPPHPLWNLNAHSTIHQEESVMSMEERALLSAVALISCFASLIIATCACLLAGSTKSQSNRYRRVEGGMGSRGGMEGGMRGVRHNGGGNWHYGGSKGGMQGGFR